MLVCAVGGQVDLEIASSLHTTPLWRNNPERQALKPRHLFALCQSPSASAFCTSSQSPYARQLVVVVVVVVVAESQAEPRELEYIHM